MHTGIVTDAGDLLMCGFGMDGRRGLGDEDERTTPTLVVRALFDGEAVLMVACGAFFTAAVTEGGGVYNFHGKEGMLGHGDEEHQLAPRRVPAAAFNGELVVMVAAGLAHTVALSEAGHVFTWGYGEYWQLGRNDRENQRAPRQMAAGRFGEFVAAGGNYTVAVTAGERLYTWDEGCSGQLGHGDTGNRLVPTLVGAWAFGGSAVVMAACFIQRPIPTKRERARTLFIRESNRAPLIQATFSLIGGTRSCCQETNLASCGLALQLQSLHIHTRRLCRFAVFQYRSCSLTQTHALPLLTRASALLFRHTTTSENPMPPDKHP